MIDAALVLLETTDLPSWQDDAPLRRELIALRDDVRAFTVAAGYDMPRAARKAALVNERADRIRDFLKGYRYGTDARRLRERLRMPL